MDFKKTTAEKEDAGCDIVAMANKNGGVIFFGVKPNGAIVGCPNGDKEIRELANFFSGNIEPALPLEIIGEELDGKGIIKIVIPKSKTPSHTFKQRFYLRMGTETQSKGLQAEYQRRLIALGSPDKDFSASVLAGATLEDLDPSAILELRTRLKESGRFDADIDHLDDTALLTNLRLLDNGKITIAALVLLGKLISVARYIPNAEVKYAYQTTEGEQRGQDMVVYEGGYFLNHASIWAKIDSRNIQLEIPEGLFLRNRKAFDSETVREAINNAIIHRDYLQQAPVFIVQHPTDIEVKSPGSLPDGVTLENIRDESRPRNKLIARVLRFAGFVEEFGTGVNLMFKNQLASGKAPPVFTVDSQHVSVRIDGAIRDIEFVRYITKVTEKYGRPLSDDELILLDSIRRGERIPAARIPNDLLKFGLIERVGYGKYMLSKEYYRYAGLPVEYTKRKGLSKMQKKALILEHLKNFPEGTKKADLLAVLDNAIHPMQLYRWLVELKQEGRVVIEGKPTSPNAKWKLIQG